MTGYSVAVEVEPEPGGATKKSLSDAEGGAPSTTDSEGCTSPGRKPDEDKPISSPSAWSISSWSTRTPDSDSEEFELEAKDGEISEGCRSRSGTIPDATETSQESNEAGPSAQLGAAVAAAQAAAEAAAKAAKEAEKAKTRQEPPRCRRRQRGVCDPHTADLAYFRRCIEVQFQPWVNGDFATVGRIAKSVHGEVQYLRDRDGRGVAAKVIPTSTVMQSRGKSVNEQNAWFLEDQVPTIEDPWNEIAVLTYLQRSVEQCRFTIKLLDMFQDNDSTFVITEYCDGGELFERVAYGDALTEAESRQYITQILHAVRYLHGHNVGHRDISLENVLLRKGDCVLMDFGQAVRLRAMDGTVLRYFAEAGKRMYRAPEMYVPREQSIQVACPMGAVPGGVAQVSYDRCRCEVLLPADATPGRMCFAEPHGYAVSSADLFACGVCAFVLTVGKPPWSIARDSDPTFSFIRRHGVPALLRQWRGVLDTAPHEEDALLADMLRVEPTKRPGLDECLRNDWLLGTPAKSS